MTTGIVVGSTEVPRERAWLIIGQKGAARNYKYLEMSKWHFLITTGRRLGLSGKYWFDSKNSLGDI